MTNVYQSRGGVSLRGLFQVGDEVCPLLGLLDTSKHHLRPGDELLRVFKINKKSVLRPSDPFAFIGVGVGETRGLASFPAVHAVEVWADFMLASRFYRMTLSTSGNKRLLALLGVTSWNCIRHS